MYTPFLILEKTKSMKLTRDKPERERFEKPRPANRADDSGGGAGMIECTNSK